MLAGVSNVENADVQRDHSSHAPSTMARSMSSSVTGGPSCFSVPVSVAGAGHDGLPGGPPIRRFVHGIRHSQRVWLTTRSPDR